MTKVTWDRSAVTVLGGGGMEELPLTDYYLARRQILWDHFPLTDDYLDDEFEAALPATPPRAPTVEGQTCLVLSESI